MAILISTRHAGIPDVVLERQTGLLVDEHDIAATADQMLALTREPTLAGELVRNGAALV